MSTLKLIHSIVQLAETRFTATDMKNRFRKAISEHELFKYSPLTPWRMRCEMYIFVMAMARMYRSDRITDSSASAVPKNARVNSNSKEPRISRAATKLPSVLKYSFMCENIEVGDIVEYKTNASLGGSEENEFIKRATVVAIRLELDQTTKALILNDGEKLVNSLHLVRRVSMKDIHTGEPLWNPIRDWFELSHFYLHPTVDASDESGSDLARSCTDRGREEYRSQNNAWRHNVHDRARQAQIHTGDMGSFFHWMDPAKVPNEILFLNALYRTCVEIGKLTPFYNILKCHNQTKYETARRNLRRDVFTKRERLGAIVLKFLLSFLFFVKFTNAKGDTEVLPGVDRNAKRPTKRAV